MSRTLLVSLSMLLGAAQLLAQPAPPWNREATGVAVTPAADGTPGAFDVHAAWAFSVEPTSAPLDLGTRVELRINGATVSSLIVPVQVNGGSGTCATGTCSGTCGNSTIDGIGNDLFCDPDECDCRPLDWVSTFPTTPLSPGDEIMVILYPAPGALPDDDTSDDFMLHSFDGDPVFWDRGIESVQFLPTPGAPQHTYDVMVNWRAAAANIYHQLGMRSILIVLVNGVETASVDGCFDWITASPSVACTVSCLDIGCGDVGYCGGTTGLASCKPTDLGCACVASNADIIPGVSMMPGDEIMVLLRPAPGALPPLPGFDEDDASLQAAPIPGDMNCDGVVSFADIPAFVKALSGEAAYLAAYPDCRWLNGDIDLSGAVTFVDIQPFVSLLTQ